MASETTFGQWKVVFSLGKVRKRAPTFQALRARFLNLHIWIPYIESDNLAKTESLLIFVEQNCLKDNCEGYTVDTFGMSLKTHNCHHHHRHHQTLASSNWLPSGVIISLPALLSFPSTSMFLLKNKEHSANSSLYSSLYFNVITCLNSGRCENHVQKQLHFNVSTLQLEALCQQHTKYF